MDLEKRHQMSSEDRSSDTSSICCLAFIFALLIVPISLFAPYVTSVDICNSNEFRVNRNVCEDCNKYMPGCYTCSNSTYCS